MDIGELRAKCAANIEFGCGVVLVMKKGWKPPPRFPRGELMCENHNGDLVRRYDASRILKWIAWAEKEMETKP